MTNPFLTTPNPILTLPAATSQIPPPFSFTIRLTQQGEDDGTENIGRNTTTVVLVRNLTAAFPDLAASVPACGLQCIIGLAPNAKNCLILEEQQQQENGENGDRSTNGRLPDSQRQKDCLCAPDQDSMSYYPTILSCLEQHCDMEEAVETARGAWETCDQAKDSRSRKADIWAPLSIEIPALLCALLRLYSRWWSVSKFEADDYIMMVVVVLFVPFEVMGIYAANTAFGRDIWTVQASKLTLSLKLFYVGESFYLAILTLTKISILVFYLRIFPSTTFRAITYIIILWIAISGIVSVFIQIFQCTPVSFIWEGWKRGHFGPHRCLDVHALGFATAALGAAQDLVIIIMPLPLLAKLNVSRRCKIEIIIMFSLGVFVTITSCVRLWSLISFGESANPTWDYTNIIIWTGLEVAVSIIVTSLPAIRVLINRRIPWLLGSVLGFSGNGVWGPDGEYRGYGAASTSSFGDTTFDGSMYTNRGTPSTLKRLSAISHVSSLKVERLTGSSWGYVGSFEDKDEKGAGGDGAGMGTSQAIDFGGEKGSEELARAATWSETTDYSYASSMTFEMGKEEGDEAVHSTRLSPRPSSLVRPLPHPPSRLAPARPPSQASVASIRPLPHPPARANSQLQSPRAPQYPPARLQSQSHPRGPRPLSQPNRVNVVKRGGPIAPLPNIADVLMTEMAEESLPEQPALQEPGVAPMGWKGMTIRKVEDGT
ncbi:hypothetical protein V8F20_008408 [Naviculisporaceae sp. PSN 640]